MKCYVICMFFLSQLFLLASNAGILMLPMFYQGVESIASIPNTIEQGFFNEVEKPIGLKQIKKPEEGFSIEKILCYTAYSYAGNVKNEKLTTSCCSLM